jgi:hypothetical protein
LLGPIGGKAKVWAECLFADPIGDIALLGSPDTQELWNEAEAYEKLVDGAQPLSVGDMPSQAKAKLPGLDGRWIGCLAKLTRARIWITQADADFKGGMSGSPILIDDVAVGVFTTAGGRPDEVHKEGGPQACLTRNLPGWLLLDLSIRAA